VYNGLVTDPAEGDRLAQQLSGPKRVLMHKHHGVMVAAKSIAEAVWRIYFLERAAQVQVYAMSTGTPLAVIEHADELAHQFELGVDGNGDVDMFFAAYKRSLTDKRYHEALC
jgi:ribulose-5-phosphate 4-epimerase/fuculose-1-phosphate aldolase